MNSSPSDISRKILFVDDEVLLLEGVKRQLRREFELSVAESGKEALNILSQEGPFAIVVSDYNMPNMDGIAFLNAVHQQYPQTILVMLTGRAELDIAVNALHNAHISRFLNKPSPKEVLQETLNDGLEQYRLRISEQLLKNQLQQANQQLNQLNNQLEALVAEKTRALQLQYHYVANISQLSNSQAIIDALIQATKDLTGTMDLTLWLNRRMDGQFICHHPADHNINAFTSDNIPDGIIADTLRNNTAWIRDSNTPTSSEFDQSLFNAPPILCQPLRSEQGLLGLLNLGGGDCTLERDAMQALTAMADVTGTALQSHWHREAFTEAQDAIITALAKLSEYRDPETGAHLLRLKKYCGVLCEFLATTPLYHNIITTEFTQDLVRSSPLHDIGKVGIADAILKKPGRLTEEEFEIMKTHASIGGDTLRSVYEQYPSQSFIKCGMEIAYSHHEKWDGSGYPLGLKAEEIPLSARILALVDVYDALTCRRIYKAPFPRDQAKEMIINGRGSHFAPDLIDAFVAVESEFNAIAEQYSDTH